VNVGILVAFYFNQNTCSFAY